MRSNINVVLIMKAAYALYVLARDEASKYCLHSVHFAMNGRTKGNINPRQLWSLINFKFPLSLQHQASSISRRTWINFTRFPYCVVENCANRQKFGIGNDNLMRWANKYNNFTLCSKFNLIGVKLCIRQIRKKSIYT